MISQIGTTTLLVSLPFVVIFSTNLVAHSAFSVSTNVQFLQSFFFFHCSPDRFAILRSILYEGTAAAAVLPEQLQVAQLAAAVSVHQVH
jgi:hypothetical protein